MPATVPLATIQNAQRFQLRVRTDSPVLDQFVYELVYQQFSDVLPLAEKEPFSGTMEVTFLSSAQNWASGSPATTSTDKPASAGAVTWQNSSMLIVLKMHDGQRLWSADYNYKGGWELSSWSVHTPDEAARLLVKRLKSRFLRDFRKSDSAGHL